ncbi:hypothetical protein QPK87_12970 [Kamptonema cortianum]|nr:hypothetical protein [Kamptonema cortianum]
MKQGETMKNREKERGILGRLRIQLIMVVMGGGMMLAVGAASSSLVVTITPSPSGLIAVGGHECISGGFGDLFRDKCDDKQHHVFVGGWRNHKYKYPIHHNPRGDKYFPDSDAHRLIKWSGLHEYRDDEYQRDNRGDQQYYRSHKRVGRIDKQLHSDSLGRKHISVGLAEMGNQWNSHVRDDSIEYRGLPHQCDE